MPNDCRGRLVVSVVLAATTERNDGGKLVGRVDPPDRAVTVGDPRAQLGAGAGRGLDLERAVDERQPLAHADQAEAARLLLRVEAGAVVADGTSVISPSSALTSTATRWASACLATLVSASCTSR